jgi:hypothetical protein
MKHIFLLLGLLVHVWAAGQCPVTDIRFVTQSEIDNFPTNYPGCTAPAKSIIIDTEGAIANIQNLNGLQNLTSIGGNLDIFYTSITSLAPLQNLTTINGSLSLRFNFDLYSLNGLENLEILQGGLQVYSVPVSSLAPLGKLESIAGLDITSTLIPNFLGMENLKHTNYMNILFNDELTSLKGLDNVEPLPTVHDNIEIVWNDKLSDCLIKYICFRSRDREGFTDNLIANAPGCMENTIDDLCYPMTLPVTLIDFKGKNEGSNVLLSWTTSSETNSKHFEVQKSTNAQSWQSVGIVNAQGESASSIIYTFVDRSVGQVEALYRLKMVDSDGTFAYSKIVNVNFRRNRLSGIHPNPVSGKVFLSPEDLAQMEKIAVYDKSGKIVYQTVEVNQDGINVSQLAAGLYILTVRKKNQSSVSYKMFKL